MTWKIDYKNLLMAFDPDTPAAADKTVSLTQSSYNDFFHCCSNLRVISPVCWFVG